MSKASDAETTTSGKPNYEKPNLATQAENAKDAAVEKVQSLRQTAEQKAAEIKEAAAAKAEAIKYSATDTTIQVRDYAEESYQDARLYMREVHTSFEDHIRANPTQSVLTAAAVGFVLGFISRR